LTFYTFDVIRLTSLTWSLARQLFTMSYYGCGMLRCGMGGVFAVAPSQVLLYKLVLLW